MICKILFKVMYFEVSLFRWYVSVSRAKFLKLFERVQWTLWEFWKNLRCYTPTHRVGAILQSPCSSVCPFVRPSVHTFVTDIYFLFTVRLRIFHVCRNENFHNSYLSFYWKKWFYIWYMALAWKTQLFWNVE